MGDPNHGLPLPRSSHGISAHLTDDGKTRLILYGGENCPRTPISDQLWLAEGSDDNEWKWISPRIASDSHEAPRSRLGHAQASVGKSVYIFGGRGNRGGGILDVDISESAMDDLYKIEIIHSPHWPFCPDYTVKYTK